MSRKPRGTTEGLHELESDTLITEFISEKPVPMRLALFLVNLGTTAEKHLGQGWNHTSDSQCLTRGLFSEAQNAQRYPHLLPSHQSV